MTPRKLAIVLVGLLVLAAGIPAPADAAQVVLFYSSRFVDTEDNHGSQEAVNLRMALGALGHTVTTIAGPNDPVGNCGPGVSQAGTVLATAAAYSAALASADVFVIPEQESFCYMPGELLDDHPDVAAVWRNWVTNGGGLVIHSSNEARQKVDDLLAVVFNFRIPSPVNGNDVTTSKRPAAATTRFAAGPATLPGNDSSGLVRVANLPANAISVYDDGTFASVVIVPFGAGKIILLGWDWSTADPPEPGGQNGGWYPTILDGAVKEAGERTLTVTKAGTGGGTVTSEPAGIACGATCAESFPTGTLVTLQVAPAAGSRFVGWTGAADCADGQVTMTGAVTCIATFSSDALLVTGVGPGGGPHVRLFRIEGGSIVAVGSGFFAYDPAFTGGIAVTLADIDGDGVPEVITGAGPGGGPHVQIFRVNPATGQATRLGSGFFAYAAEFRGGVTVEALDVDGDGRAEIVTAPGAGGGPHVRVFKIDPGTGAATAFDGGGFFAYDSAFRGGVTVAGE